MASSNIDINIRANTKEAQDAITGFANRAGGSLGSIESSFGSISLLAKAAVGFLAGRQIIRGFEAIIDASADAEKSLNSMRSALKLSGSFSEAAAKSFEDLAEQIQATSIFDDDVVLGQVAMAKSFGLTNEQAKKLIVSATELSAATGVSLDTAVEQLGKTFDGTVGKLKESLPELRKFSAAQLEAGAAVDYVNQRFGGAALEATKTYAGAILQAKNNFSNLLETLGGFITTNSTLIRVIAEVSAAFVLMNNALKANEDALSKLVTAGIKRAVEAVGIFIQILKLLDIYLTSITKTLIALVNLKAGNIKAIMESFSNGFTDLGERGKLLDAATQSVADLSVALDKVNTNNKKVAASNKAVSASLPKVREETLQALKQIQEQYKNGALSQLQIIEKEKFEHIKAIQDAETQRIISRREAQYLIEKINSVSLKKMAEEQQKVFDDLVKRASSNPFSAAFGQIPNDGSAGQKGAIGAGAIGGGLSLALKGQQGAVEGAKLFAQAAAIAIAGPLGQALGPVIGDIVGVLAQGPEKVKEFIEGFVNGIPIIIDNIVKSIPVVTKELVKGAPQVMGALAKTSPLFIREMIKQAPSIIFEMVKAVPELIKEMTAGFLEIPGKFVTELINELKGKTGDLLPKIPGLPGGGGDGSFLGGLGGLLNGGAIGGIGGAIIGGSVGGIVDGWFADGGTVPQGYPNDSFMAGLTSGEGVITRDLNPRLQAFLDRQDNIKSSGGPQVINVNLKVGEKELANVLLDLSRRGFRTA